MWPHYAIIRTGTGLWRQTWPPFNAGVDPPDQCARLADISPPIGPDRAPLSTAVTDRAVKTAWDSLADVRQLTADTLKSVLVVLIETVPEAFDRPMGAPPFRAPIAPTAPAPTAAHPRAYQGTTQKPPKTKASAAVDVRAYLCNPAAVSDLLTRLAPHWDEAVSKLERLGYTTPALASPDCDPYAAWNHGNRQSMLTPDIAPLYRTLLLPSLRGKAWSDVERVHQFYLHHRLGDRPEIVYGVAAMLRKPAGVHGITDWCRLMMELPAACQAGFATLVLSTGAWAVDPISQPDSFRDIILEVAAGPDPAYRTYCLLRGVANEIDGRYLASGFRLSDLLYPDRTSTFARSFHEVTAWGYYPEEAVLRLMAHLDGIGTDFEPPRITSVWRACGLADGFGAFIQQRPWTQWPPETAQAVLRIYLVPFGEERPLERQRKWDVLRASADLIETTLHDVPEAFRLKFCDSLREYVWLFDTGQITENSIANACALLTRICRPPFHPRRNTANVWLDFLTYLSPSQQDEILSARDSEFMHMEKACRTTAAATLIGSGTWALAKRAPTFSLAGFLAAPARMLRTAKTLGCLSSEERLLIVDEFTRTPMMQTDIETLNDAEAYSFIRQHEGLFRASPIPRALRSHYDDGITLNGPRSAHYHEQMRQQWRRACWERLEETILERLARGFPIDEVDDNARHALQFERGTKDNRRALRKFLSAYWSGRRDYIAQHPLTRQWLKNHPKLNIDLWMTGITVTGQTPPNGTVTIALETDPLEALKLGTHVGSCLSLGGILQYSAVANVLDINKQVLYARDAAGAVIGRQIVAYSEAGELVCFSVYPLSASDELQGLFASYDQQFAAALSIPLFGPVDDVKPHDDEYDVARILSSNWWDDGYWNPTDDV
jgi:hypothetical protein